MSAAGGLFEIIRGANSQTSEEELTLPYRQSSYAYIGIRAIATTLASIPFRFWRDNDLSKAKVFTETLNKHCDTDLFRLKENMSTLNSVNTHYLIDLFKSPNPMQTGFEFWEAVVTYMYTYGSCLVRIDKDSNGKVQHLYPFRGDIWTVKLDSKGHPASYEASFLGGSRRVTKSYPADNIIVFKLFDVENIYRGMAPSVPATSTLLTDYEARLYNQQFFKNNAETGVVLSTEQNLNAVEAKEIKDSFDRNRTGAENAGKTAILTNGLKAQVLRSSHRDMQYSEMQDINRDEILAVYGVPKPIAGIIDDVNRATFLGSSKIFYTLTIIPLIRRLASVLYARFFKNIEPNLYGIFDISQVQGLRGDTKEKAEIAAIYHRMGIPFNVLNVRFDLGFPTGLEFHEVGYMPFGFKVEDVYNGETVGGGSRPPENNTTEDESLLNDEKAVLTQLIYKLACSEDVELDLLRLQKATKCSLRTVAQLSSLSQKAEDRLKFAFFAYNYAFCDSKSPPERKKWASVSGKHELSGLVVDFNSEFAPGIKSPLEAKNSLMSYLVRG